MDGPGPRRKCPICGARFDWREIPSRPFCSDRCKLIDLGSWVSGRYAIPGKKLERDAGSSEPGKEPGEEGPGGEPPPEPGPGKGSRRS